MEPLEKFISTIVGTIGMCALHDGRYVVVKQVGKDGVDSEWYLIIADEIDDAIAYEGPEDDSSVWSAVPYLTHEEALGEASDLLKNYGDKLAN